MTITDWTHIAIVYREKTPYLYINGEFIKQGLKSNKNTVYASGFFGGYEPYGYYVGFLKEIRIWSYERSKKEINENLNNTFIGNENGLFGYWTFKGNLIKSTNKHNFNFKEFNKKDIKMIFVVSNAGLIYPDMEKAIIQALRKTVKDLIVVSPNDDILKIVHETNPNIILYFSSGMLTQAHLDVVSQLRIKKALWLTDDPYYMDYTQNVVSFFDIVFTQELNCVNIYKLRGCQRVYYLPLAVDTEIFHPKSVGPEYVSDILFVGSAFTERIKMFDKMARYFSTKNLRIIGNGWEKLSKYRILAGKIQHQWASPEETAKYYNGAKIVINFHRTTDDRYVNLNSRNISAFSINPRTFEISACGSFQLTDLRKDLINQYSPGDDNVTYSSHLDLMHLLEYYLNHPDERRIIANRGLQRTLSEHTNDHRINKLVDRLFD